MNFKRFKNLFLSISLLIVSGLSLTSCDPDKIVVEKYSEVLCEAVYACGDALLAGRPDLAEEYIVNAEKILPFPSKRFVITPVIYNGVHYVVLNDRERGSKIIMVGDAEFNSLLKLKIINQQQQIDADKFSAQASKQAADDKAALDEVVKANDKLTKELAAANVEITAYHNSIEYKIKSFIHKVLLFSFFGISGSIIIIVCLLIFVPPAAPLVFEVLGSTAGIVTRAAKYLWTTFLSLSSWIHISPPNNNNN